eukprot:746515-Hanusia_phi.AAC.3
MAAVKYHGYKRKRFRPPPPTGGPRAQFPVPAALRSTHPLKQLMSTPPTSLCQGIKNRKGYASLDRAVRQSRTLPTR